MPRLSGPPDDVSAETADLLTLTAGLTGTTPATIDLLAHHPKLLGPFLTWARALALDGDLPAREHEILALRAAHNCHSPFEWHEHAGFARTAGLAEAEIEAIAAGPEAAGWSAADRALLIAADELHTAGALSDETYAALNEHFGPGAIVEISMIVGQYTMLSMLCGAFAVPAAGG